jgi:hypothetical protein
MSNSACLKGAANLFFNLSSDSDARSSTKATTRVEDPGVRSAKRHHAVRRVVAAEPAWHEGRRVDRWETADQAARSPTLRRSSAEALSRHGLRPGRPGPDRDFARRLRTPEGGGSEVHPSTTASDRGAARRAALWAFRSWRAGFAGSAPEHSQVLVAKQAETLDVLSGGRFVLGVGRSRESSTARVPFRGRAARPVKYVAAIRALSREDTASFAGEFVSFDFVRVYPKPLRARSKGRRSQETIGRNRRRKGRHRGPVQPAAFISSIGRGLVRMPITGFGGAHASPKSITRRPVTTRSPLP